MRLLLQILDATHIHTDTHIRMPFDASVTSQPQAKRGREREQVTRSAVVFPGISNNQVKLALKEVHVFQRRVSEGNCKKECESQRQPKSGPSDRFPLALLSVLMTAVIDTSQ